MSLLLDALKPTEAEDSGAGVEPEAAELQEEPLDGPATLALLASRPSGRTNAQAHAETILSLVPTSGIAPVPAASAPEQFGPGPVESSVLGPSLVEPAPAALALAAPAPVAEARIAPNPERSPSASPARIAEAAPTPGAAAAATAKTRAPISASTAKPRAKTYALAGAALAALVGVGIVAKSLWWPSTNAIIYPAVGEPQQTPPGVAAETAPSIAAVQVSSARPADQFAYAGNAPEIDLRNTEPPTNATARGNDIPAAGATPSPGTTQPPSEVAPRPRVAGFARGAATRASIATLSVTRSEGPSPIDRHVQAGYLALGAGNVANAQTEYLAALELDPNNVDALMGVATVAARDGNPKAAAAAYLKVLKLEPGNPDATAAITSLGANGSNAENSESQLKILIASGDGGRPALHAALAGVYAADSRWPEATQEYFTALAKDPGNPDLAFDVAASLDQNRNPGMALAYYGQALIFARQRPTQIDLHAIEQRMSQLQAQVGRSPAPETP
jgi:tetratricopeptide (TPR) repeat protein